jgi:hypothetical protein
MPPKRNTGDSNRGEEEEAHRQATAGASAAVSVATSTTTTCPPPAGGEDPFDVFGEDEESSELEDGENHHHLDVARSLVLKANQDTSTESEQPVSGKATDTSMATVSSMVPIELPWEGPLYAGNIQLVSALPVGGGRGYVAKEMLQPGTLVLVEEPILAWPEGEAFTIDLERIHVILMSDKAQQIVRALESFHPTRELVNKTMISPAVPSDCPAQVEDMIQFYRKTIKTDDVQLKTILQVAAVKEVGNADGSPLEEIDVLRMLVALRYNSLETGIYLHVAMLNHADLPNCVKFKPDKEKAYSEVRTTRSIQPGEPLTISYIQRYLCHSSRKQYLWEQHRFHIKDMDHDYQKFPFEHVNKRIPSSSDIEMMQNIETATAQLLEQWRELNVASASLTGKYLSEDDSENAKALELASLELYTSSLAQLQNDKHLLLLPCLMLHLDACDLVQRHIHLSKSQRVSLLMRLVSTGRTLSTLQCQVLGEDHFEIAKTKLDIS